MDRWATKDHYELETEEADRLVRPAPKVKPPRHDKRREETRPDRDPDIDDDPDVAKDPDLSMNYKNVGGSIARRVLARFLHRGDVGPGSDLVKVKHVPSGRIVQVKPETLKAKPGEYEEVEKEEPEKPPKTPLDWFYRMEPGKVEKPGEKPPEAPPKAEEKPPEPPKAEEKPPEPPKKEVPTKPSEPEKRPPGEKDEAFYQDAGRVLLDSAKVDLRLKGVLKDVANPESELGGMAGYAPQLPAAPFLKGVKVPEGIETLGDLQKAVLHGRRAPKKKPPAAPPPAAPPPTAPPAAPPPPAAAPHPEAAKVDDRLERVIDRLEQFTTNRDEVENLRKELETVRSEVEKLRATPEEAPPKAKPEKKPPESVPPEQLERAANLARWSADLTDDARKNSNVAFALYQLGNPASTVAKTLAGVKDFSDPRIDQALPSLREASLPPDMTFRDLQDIAKVAFKPIPPPKRDERGITREDRLIAKSAMNRAFQKHPALLARVDMLDLHPQDVNEVLGTYRRAMAAKIRPDELDKRIKAAQESGLYSTDPSNVLPPKSGRDAKGRVKAWGDLTPEEQSEVYARHRNQVIATTFALRDLVSKTFQDAGIAPRVAHTLALAKLSHKPGESEAARDHRGRQAGTAMLDNIIRSGKRVEPLSDDTVERTLKSAGKDPLAQKLAVANFQANDYQQARQQWLDPSSPDHIDERAHARNIAAKLRQATEYLRRTDNRYPPEHRSGNMAEKFRRRVMSRLMALNPEKASEIEPEVQKMDADDWDRQKETVEAETKKWKATQREYEKAAKKIQREFDAEMRAGKGGPGKAIKSVKQRLEEAGVREPIPPQPLPPKPVGYDLVRKTPRGQAQSGESLWRRLLKGLTASERVAGRFLYSSCAPGGSMGSPPMDRRASTDRTGVYWGVDPTSKEKVVNLPHTPWQQAHARDLGDKDYNAILAAAREWMKVPVLARVLDEKDSLGAVRDIQIRAALDLALRDLEGGKYAVGLHPTVYNNLLAQLGGKSEKDTLLTVRQANEAIEAAPKGWTKDPSGKWVKGPGAKERKELEKSDAPLGNVERWQLEKLKKKEGSDVPTASGSLYSQTTGEGRSMNAAAEIRKFAAEIAASHPALAFDLTNLAFRVAEEEQQGQGQEQDKKPDFLKDKDAAAAKYAALRSAVIRIAHENPAVRPALVPVLQTLK